MSIGGVAALHQRSFDELGRPLSDVTFCIVDLETTGGNRKDDLITEIGAVKVRGGEVRFQVRAEQHLPTAAASILSKYLREVSMEMFNRFWIEHEFFGNGRRGLVLRTVVVLALVVVAFVVVAFVVVRVVF